MVLGTAAVTAVVCGLGYALGCEDDPASGATGTEVAARTKYTRVDAGDEQEDAEAEAETVRRDAGAEGRRNEPSAELPGAASRTAGVAQDEETVKDVLRGLVDAVEADDTAAQVRLVLGRVVEQVIAENTTASATASTPEEDKCCAACQPTEAFADGSNQADAAEEGPTTKDEDRPEAETADDEPATPEDDAAVKHLRGAAERRRPIATAARSSNNDEDQ
ncbi:hypothetical protein ATCC90586_009829 [Pythium insidiosum]|nr:hypothetical protein ATCC90586_009829 [Pythium insidiosum]